MPPPAARPSAPRPRASASAAASPPPQLLLRWSIQRGVAAIPQSVTPSRIAENFAVGGLELSAEDMATLSGLDQGMRLLKGAAWRTADQTYDSFWDTDFKVPSPMFVASGSA